MGEQGEKKGKQSDRMTERERRRRREMIARRKRIRRIKLGIAAVTLVLVILLAFLGIRAIIHAVKGGKKTGIGASAGTGSAVTAGQNTAEVFGDYASGTNHTLPTLGAARYTGGVWVGTFLKVCTDQSMTDQASSLLAPLVARLAEKEGLMAHKHAAQLRTGRK